MFIPITLKYLSKHTNMAIFDFLKRKEKEKIEEISVGDGRKIRIIDRSRQEQKYIDIVKEAIMSFCRGNELFKKMAPLPDGSLPVVEFVLEPLTFMQGFLSYILKSTTTAAVMPDEINRGGINSIYGWT